MEKLVLGIFFSKMVALAQEHSHPRPTQAAPKGPGQAASRSHPLRCLQSPLRGAQYEEQWEGEERVGRSPDSEF